MVTDTQPYRTIGITSTQIDRLPMWAKLAIARADATIIQRENALRAIADAKIDDGTDYRELCALLMSIATIALNLNDSPSGTIDAAIAKARGDA